MAHSVEMPELGESVTEGTITQWLKSVGDTVEVDEPLLEVSTDKVDTEIPSPVAGTLLEIKADEDDTIEVGEVIATIGDEGESVDSDSDSKAEAKEEEKDEEPKKEEKAEESSSKDSGASGDATDVEMPELGESVTEGTITQWLKSVGDTVEVDEPLLEVSTDKVDTEIPSPVAGTLQEILADEDDTIEVGEVIARIGDGSAPAKSDDSDSDSKAEAKEEEKAEESSSKDSGTSGDATDVEMPELGESVTEGTITQWLKSVGDTVEVDEPLLEVSTDKVDTEIPSPVAGTLQEILADEDDTIEVGEVIAR
ncbi:biotin/lipoyl-containing protein, partial [Corynebacterium confusum]